MNSQELYLLKLIQKVEQIEQSMGEFEQIKSRQNKFLAQISKTEQLLNTLLDPASNNILRIEEAMESFEQLTNSIPKRIPKPVVIKLEEGSFIEIAKSLLLLFCLSAALIIGSQWVQFKYFDTYKNTWENVYKENSETSQKYLDKKLNEFKRQSFWQKLKNE